MAKISVVINTLNEEKNLPRALASIKDLANEVVVCDMYSDDKTVEIAQKFGAKVYNHERTNYVEPARNFALSQATSDWILILDADEEVTPVLTQRLKEITKDNSADYVLMPRKNIIFGKWMQHSRWWPDYNVRFFKKGKVVWSEIIHAVPETHGVGRDLPGEEAFAIIHYEHTSISQYLTRHDRYSTILAEAKIAEGYEFTWVDLLRKPTSEFLSRFFVGEAYKDGVHGLALSLLQAFTEVLIYLKVWEMEKFKEEHLSEQELENEFSRIEYELNHWLVAKHMRRPTIFTKLLRRLFK